jgi:hypothetical protein
VLSFTEPTARLEQLVVLVAAAAVLVALSRSAWFDRLLTPVIKRVLILSAVPLCRFSPYRRCENLHRGTADSISRSASFELRDYTRLLNLHCDYHVADLVNEGSWLANETLRDLPLRSDEGVVVLGIRREDGTYVGAPAAEDGITPGDTLVAYGQAKRLQELAGRSADDEEAHEDAKDAFRRLPRPRAQARSRAGPATTAD